MAMVVFSAMRGSTVALGDDFLELVVLSAMLGSTVALGDDFVAMVVFSAMLGSTLDTWCCQSTWPFHRCSSWTRLSCSLCARQMSWSSCSSQWRCRSCSSRSSTSPVGAQRQLPMVSLFRDHCDSLLQYTDKVDDVGCACRAGSHGCRRGGDSRAPTVALVEKFIERGSSSTR